MKTLIRPFAGVCVVALCVSCNSSSPLGAGSKASTPTAPPAPTLSFEPAVKVLPANGYGYEPTIVADAFGNLWHTSHKENYELALSPDPDSPTKTRSMSWARVSYDNGKTWTEPPGLTALSLQNHLVGDEGDMIVDDANHLYFVDTYLADNTITRWTVNGNSADKLTFDFTNAAIPTLQPSDDRPWVTAHGDGHVFFLSNEGNKNQYTLGQNSGGDGFGPGRYTVYSSYDGGKTFEPHGYTLNDSGWCRPAADHTPPYQYVYALCTNDNGALYAFVSDDDGKTYNRYDVGEYDQVDANNASTYPYIQVAPDGTVYGMYMDGSEDFANETRIRLFTSKDHGKTWSEQDITPMHARFIYVWLAITADGKNLGLAVYGKPVADTPQPWYIYGAVWKPGTVPTLVSVDPSNPVDSPTATSTGGDYLGSYFSPDGNLNIVWERAASMALSRDIYFSRTTTAPKSKTDASGTPPAQSVTVGCPVANLPGLRC